MVHFHSSPKVKRYDKLIQSVLFGFYSMSIFFAVSMWLIFGYIEVTNHNNDIFIVLSWMLSGLFLLLYLKSFHELVSKLKSKNSLVIHPLAWISHSDIPPPVPSYFLLSNGNEFFINSTTFRYKSESFDTKSLSSILILAIIGCNFLILALFIPQIRQSYNNFFIFLTIPFLSIFLFFLAFHNPITFLSSYNKSICPSWELIKNTDSTILLILSNSKNSFKTVTLNKSEILSYPFCIVESTAKALGFKDNIHYYFNKNKIITTLSFSSNIDLMANRVILFADYSMENIQMIDTCIRMWFNK